MEDDILGKDVSSFSSRQFDQTLHHVVCTGDDTDPLFSAPCLKHYDRVDILIPEERERLSFPDDGRRTQGDDLMIEILFQILLFIRFRSGKIDQSDAVLFYFPHQVFVSRIFSFIQPFYFLQDRPDLLLGSHIRLVVPYLFVHQHLILERSDSYPEELIQIALIDRYKVHSLAEGHLRILRFLDHSLIKLQPGQFPVHINVFHILLLRNCSHYSFRLLYYFMVRQQSLLPFATSLNLQFRRSAALLHMIMRFRNISK